jgi:hypothetical protein
MTEIDKPKLFSEVERLFVEEIHKCRMKYQIHSNICCEEQDEKNIIMIADELKSHKEFSDISLKDIYLVLIYTYYSLRLNEQTIDWLRMSFLRRHASDYERVRSLYFQITIGNITSNGKNLSSMLRKFIMGMRGGVTKKYRKNHKSKKSHKSKNRKTRKTA